MLEELIYSDSYFDSYLQWLILWVLHSLDNLTVKASVSWFDTLEAQKNSGDWCSWCIMFEKWQEALYRNVLTKHACI